MDKTDIFTEKLEDFLITQGITEWELQKRDYPTLINYSFKLGLLFAFSSAFSLFDSFSSIIEITNNTILEIGLLGQDLLMEKIEEDFE
jgi:hypothetical protein